jgi:hypothetical protein
MIVVERAEVLWPHQLDLGPTDGNLESVDPVGVADRKSQAAQQDQILHGMIPPALDAVAT